jgi:hypothetical protein
MLKQPATGPLIMKLELIALNSVIVRGTGVGNVLEDEAFDLSSHETAMT